MTKKHYWLVVFSVAAFILLLKKNEPLVAPVIVTYSQMSAPNPEARYPERQVINNRKEVITRLPASVSYSNRPSADWQNRLEVGLKEQAGDSLKEINIKKERSMVWVRDTNSLLVESVVITMTNKQDVKASFRAMVDSQTGKVLETWDNSIFDPADVRSGFRLSLDGREAH